jgi:uracil-DNA glycosylase family 4
MGQGFFPAEPLTVVHESPIGMSAQCNKCKLFANGCKSPKMPVYGKGRREIMVVGEGPGLEEDLRGRPFVGKTGQVLRKALAECGVDLDADCWSTNAVTCRTSTLGYGKGNVPPTDQQISYCRPNVANAIDRLKPKVIILLGGPAIDSVIGWLFKPNPGDVAKWVGWRIPSQEVNAWVFPTYHPAWVSRAEGKQDEKLVWKLFTDHLGAAVGLAGRRPWIKVPDYEKEVKVVLEPAYAANNLEDWMARERVKTFAFDFETNALKPDNESSYIHCCSVSNGKTALVFPWQGRVVEMMGELLSAKSWGKVMANAKYEIRWARRKLGIWVRNVVWDTMIAAHVLDNRKGVAGLKFLSFVHFGLGDYSARIEPYLKSREQGGYSPNRVKEAPQRDLMLYCGLDTLMTYKLYELQKEQLS